MNKVKLGKLLQAQTSSPVITTGTLTAIFFIAGIIYGRVGDFGLRGKGLGC